MSETVNEPVLEARALVKRYGRVVALDHADFDLYAGEILGVIGDNGAGKSTLIKVISGAVIPDAGEMLMDGSPVSFQFADRGAERRHRDGLPEPRSVAGAVDRRQHVSRARDAAKAVRSAAYSGCSIARTCGARRARSSPSSG